MDYTNFFSNTIILEDDLVRIEPLEEKHFELLLPVAMQKELWLYTIQQINSPQDFKKYFNTALKERSSKNHFRLRILISKHNCMWAAPAILISILATFV